MRRFFESFSTKKFKYGSFSTLMILFVIAIMVIVNLLADQLKLTFDMSANKQYSLSEDSIKIARELTQDVTITALARTGEEGRMFEEAVGPLTFQRLLDEYAKSSSHIQLVYKDPYLYPAFVTQYAKDGEPIPINSVIVESGSLFKVIQANDMISTDFDYQNYSTYVKSIDIEPRVTNAINYVTSGASATAYTVSGSDELPLQDTLRSQLELANFEIKDVNLVTSEIPEDCTILFVTQPSRDWTASAAENVKTFLQNDGRAVFCVGAFGQEYPNLDSVLSSYGVRMGQYIVAENDPSHYAGNNRIYLLSDFAPHDITQPLLDKNYMPLLVQSSGVEKTELKKSSITIEPLLTTSKQAYGKTNPNTQTIEKEPDDQDGPFDLAVAITDAYATDEEHTTKIIFIANPTIIDESVNTAIRGVNWDFLINAMNWLQDKADTVSILPKTPETAEQLTMSSMQVLVLSMFSSIILPLIILGAGLTVWLRRRHS
ncbi:MAG: GldG family protein [Clostridiales bacterium]|nr:GldG family protein [Clostridiales bacterium]